QHDHIDVPAVQLAQGGRAVVGGAHVGHMGVPAQQEGELVQSRGLVIDGEDREHVPQGSHATYTSGWNLGTRRLTFDPAPTAVSTTSPYSSPKVVRSRSSTFASPTWSPLVPPSWSRSVSGSIPAPSSSLLRWASLPTSSARMVFGPPPGWPSIPCCTAFSTSGCRHRNGTTTPSPSGAMRSVTPNRPASRACSRVR